MFELFQTVVTVALSAIVGGQVTVTRTRRLQRTIDATISLRDRLPTDGPSRATLEGHLRELVEVLVRRQRLRFGPFTEAGFSLGVIVCLTGVTLAFAGFGALMATGVLPSEPASDPTTTGDQWAGRRSSWPWREASASGRPGLLAGSSGASGGGEAAGGGAATGRGRPGLRRPLTAHNTESAADPVW